MQGSDVRSNHPILSSLVRCLDSLIVIALIIGYFTMAYDRNSAQHFLYGSAVVALINWVMRFCTEANQQVSSQRSSMKALWLAVSIFLLAAIYIGWELLYGATGRLFWMNQMFRTVAGFWLGCGILVFYFGYYGIHLSVRVKQLVAFLVMLGAVVFFWTGLKQYIQTGQRIDLKIGYPVPAGFILSTLLVLAVLVISSWKSLIAKVAYWFAIAAITYTLVALTGTRDALFVLLILTIGTFASLKHQLPPKLCQPKIYGLLVVLMLVILGGAFAHRFGQLQVDLWNFFHGIPSGSMGGRFVIWQAGIHSFLENPWGYTGNARYLVVQEFLQQHLLHHEDLVSTIMWAAQHHMHDELIEASSIQGMIGLIAVVFFYITFYRSSDCSIMHPMGRWLLASVIVFGATEPILNSDKTVLCLGFVIPLCLAFVDEKNR